MSSNRLYLTNNYSIVSKYSTVKSGYFKDHILEELIENYLNIKSGWRRTPLVNRGYAARLLAVDWIVTRSIQLEAIDCVIVFGAGFDTLAQHKRDLCNWIEIDLPEVVEKKSEFIRQNRILIDDSTDQDGTILSSSDFKYHLIAADLRKTDELAEKLSVVLAKLNTLKNVMILNEVCLCYLDIEDIKGIIETVIKCASNRAFRIHYVGYEQVKPKETSQFNRVMLNHFESLGYPLKYFPTPQQVKQLFLNKLNFNHVTVASMYQIYHNALLGIRLGTSAFQDEPFDEFEEMDLYLSHYSLVTGVLILRDPFLNELEESKRNSIDTDLIYELKNLDLKQSYGTVISIQSNLNRYGHASCTLNKDTSIFITGGFGLESNEAKDHQQHKRLVECQLLTKEKDDVISSQTVDLGEFPLDTICLDRMHGQIRCINDRLLFFCGGRQSPARHRDCNVSFLANLDDNNQLRLEHKFSNRNSTIRWRHKICPLYSQKLLQVGGIDIQGSSDTLIIWDFSSSNLGCISPIDEKYSNFFDRHSFGLDLRDESTVLILGGLQTSEQYKDRPVEEELRTILYDFRSNKPMPVKLEDQGNCYSCDVHFIDDYKLVKIGGVSTASGLDSNSSIELIDLRNYRSTIVDCQMEETFSMLTGANSCHFKSEREILTCGGGGNYFTFGTHFNRSHLIYKY